MDFRELTLQRLKHFVSQNFFSVCDYLQGKSSDSTLCWLTSSLSCKSSCRAQLSSAASAQEVYCSADPLRFMAGLETLASTDYSLCIKAGVHFTLCGGAMTLLPLVLHASVPRKKLSHACSDHAPPGQVSNLQACAGTIAKLGTEKHHREFLPRLDTLDLPGCFGYAA